jgi:hypothetical protein
MRVHKPAMMRGRLKVGSPLPSSIQNQNLMSHQDGLGNNGPEAPRLSKPDDGDDRVQKKSENVAHASDAIKLKKLKNSMACGIRLRQATFSSRTSESSGT